MSRANPRYRRQNALGATIAPGSTAVRYQIVGTVQGQIVLNNFDYLGNVAAPTFTQLNTLFGNISTNLLTSYLALMATDYAVQQENLIVISSNTIPTQTTTTHAGTVGTGPSASMDSVVAVVGEKFTSLKGQHGRGRISLPAVPSSVVTASKVTSAAYITALNTLSTKMLLVASDGTNNWALVVTTRAPAPPKLATYWSLVSGVSFKVLLGTVRRRKIGRGK